IFEKLGLNVTAVKYNILKNIILSLFCAVCLVATFDSSAQNQKRVIQLSGVVLSQHDSTSGIPGVHIYVPKAGRGTTTNSVGFFSMPVLVGDSLIVSSVGYTKQHYIVPNHPSEFLTVVFEISEDIVDVGSVEAIAFPTEEVFKEAVLALNLPPDNQIDSRNLNAELLALMLKTTPMDGPMNQRYYLSQWANSTNDRFMPRTNPFFNPFNWVKFFNSMKQNKKKKKK
ncbi:MAG TPA: carboxypeptidase-like regulatory domain-containing protein, partial [Cyclobacteriaceae bacterium]|nr:carboxypeptidase-like regulatory domain-containing protein [Cyclobacteriaceae bacterium]